MQGQGQGQGLGIVVGGTGHFYPSSGLLVCRLVFLLRDSLAQCPCHREALDTRKLFPQQEILATLHPVMYLGGRAEEGDGEG